MHSYDKFPSLALLMIAVLHWRLADDFQSMRVVISGGEPSCRRDYQLFNLADPLYKVYVIPEWRCTDST